MCNPELCGTGASSPLPLLHLVQCSAREPWPWGRAELLLPWGPSSGSLKELVIKNGSDQVLKWNTDVPELGGKLFPSHQRLSHRKILQFYIWDSIWWCSRLPMHAMKPQGQRFPVCVFVHLVSALCIQYQSCGDVWWEPEAVWLSPGGAVGSKAPTFGRSCALDEGWALAACPGALRSAAPWAPCLQRAPKQRKGGLALPLFKCKFLLVHYYHVLLQQIIKHIWLEGSTVGLFILTGCFFSVLWLRAVLAAGFVPNKQHGSFVMEKWHMLGLFLTQQTSKTFRELVQTNVYCNFIAKEEKQREKCSKKALSKPIRNSWCGYLCPNWHKNFLQHQQGLCCCLGLVVSDSAGYFLFSILQFRSLHLSCPWQVAFS